MAIPEHSCGPLIFIHEHKSVGCCWCDGGMSRQGCWWETWGACAAPRLFFPSCSPAVLLIWSVLHVTHACCMFFCLFNHRGCELRIRFFKILCPVWVWGHPELRPHTHGSGAPRPCQVPTAGLYGKCTWCRSRFNSCSLIWNRTEQMIDESDHPRGRLMCSHPSNCIKKK